MMLYNRPIRALLLQGGKQPININNNYEYKALKLRQETCTKNNDNHKDSTLFSSGSTVVAQMEGGGPWMMAWLLKARMKTTEGDHIKLEWWRQTE